MWAGGSLPWCRSMCTTASSPPVSSVPARTLYLLPRRITVVPWPAWVMNGTRWAELVGEVAVVGAADAIEVLLGFVDEPPPAAIPTPVPMTVRTATRPITTAARREGRGGAP